MKTKKENKYLFSLLIRLLTHHEDHEQYIGDIEELFYHHKNREGNFKANLYLLGQILRSIPYFITTSVYWGTAMLFNYFKLSFRNLKKNKLYSLLNISGLAIGVACALLIYLWVSYQLSFDKHQENYDNIYRVVQVEKENPEDGAALVGAPWGPAIKQSVPEIIDFTRLRYFGRTLFEYEGKQVFESGGLYADSSIFNIFTCSFIEGNPETALTNPGSLVLTRSLKEKYFGNRSALGQTLLLDNNKTYKVTGVIENIPLNSHFVFRYLGSMTEYKNWDLTEWSVINFYLYVLLPDDVNREEVEGKITDTVLKNTDKVKFDQNPVKLQKLSEIHLYSNLYREFADNGSMTHVIVFSVIALMIILIAGINFVNLSTAQSMSRALEVGIRKAVGSERVQLIYQFMCESNVVSFISVYIGVIFAWLLLPEFENLTQVEFSVNPGITELFLLVIGLPALLGILSGFYPSLVLSAFRPARVLRGKFSTSNIKNGLRKSLVVIQFSISVVLIFSTIVVFNQLGFISSKNLGFDKEQVMVVRTYGSKIATDYKTFASELLKNNSIENASGTSNLLGGSDWGMTFKTEENNEIVNFKARSLVVDENFMSTMKMELVEGRAFTLSDYNNPQGSYIINQTALKSLGWDNPVDHRLGLATGKDENGNWIMKYGSVIGVVKDFHFRSLHEEIEPLVMLIKPEWFGYVSLRVKTQNLQETIEYINQTWSLFVPDRPLDYFFLNEEFEALYQSEKKLGDVVGIFSFISIFIACLGLFSLSSYMTILRTKEVGVRKTLGASINDIIFILTKEFALLVFIANLAALPLSYLLMQNWLDDFVYRISMGVDTFLLTASASFLIAFTTVAYHAVKTALINPVKLIKYE